MKIIKRGNPKPKTRKFTCDYCGTIFIADNTEYKEASQMECLEGIKATCKCPVCGKIADC